MTGEGRAFADRVPAETRALRSALTEIVSRLRPEACLATVRRRPLARASSWRMEELRIGLDDGRSLQMVFKDLGNEAPGSRAHHTKPLRVQDPEREPWVYRQVLGPLGAGTPDCLGSVSERRCGRHWLFLEAVEGPPLGEIGDMEVWREAARWLARFHARAARIGGHRGPVIIHDSRLHRGWLRRAMALTHEQMRRADSSGGATRARLAALAEIAVAHAAAADAVSNLSRGFIHGEFYPSNILVENDGSPRVRPVDWEMAGWGPYLLDVASLTAGRLTADERADLEEAYRLQAVTEGLPMPGDARFRRELAICRLLQAVQWLGWGRDWTPPREHHNDWLQEALGCAQQLTA
jgi:hypothetical protein